jgi:hypothetical protein
LLRAAIWRTVLDKEPVDIPAHDEKRGGGTVLLNQCPGIGTGETGKEPAQDDQVNGGIAR